jgi:hypothetical protein
MGCVWRGLSPLVVGLLLLAAAGVLVAGWRVLLLSAVCVAGAFVVGGVAAWGVARRWPARR